MLSETIRFCDRGVDTAVDQDGDGPRRGQGNQVQGLRSPDRQDFGAELEAESMASRNVFWSGSV